MTDATLLDRMALAVNAEIKRQLAGQPIPGVPDPTGWTATGSSIDLRLCALAVARVLLSEPIDEDAASLAADDAVHGDDLDIDGDSGAYMRVSGAQKAFRIMASARLAALTGGCNG